MRTPRNPRLAVLMFAVCATISCAQDAPLTTVVAAKDIETSLVPDKKEVMLGEPVYLSYVVKNKSAKDLQVVVGGDYRNGLGRPDSFTVTVTEDNGAKVPQPKTSESMGGVVTSQVIPASGSYVFRLFLPHWAVFDHPGSYVIKAQRILKLQLATKGDDRFNKGDTDVESEARTPISVTLPDTEQMGRLIEDLGAKLLSKGNRHEAHGPVEVLGAIRDERVIPHWIKALQSDSYEMKFAALLALSGFNTDLALEGLKQGMKTTGKNIGRTATADLAEQSADSIRHSAAIGLSRSPHPDALPLLLTHRRDTSYAVRLDVVHALGNKMKAAEAAPLLEEMSNDANPMVSGEAKRYLQRMEAAR